MLFDRGMPSLLVAADMAGDPFVFVETLDGRVGNANIDLFFDQLVGDAVIMPIHFNVIVDVYPGLFPFGKLIGCLRQRF